MVSRLRAASVFVVIFTMLVLPACNFSKASDVTPASGSEYSVAGTAKPDTEQSTAAALQTETRSGPAGNAADNTTLHPTETISDSVVITGKVSNLSGSKVPAGLPVELQGYVDMENVITQATVLSDDSTFEFPPLDVVEGQMFIITVEYKGIVFSSDIIDASSLASAKTWPVEINIYENTTDLIGIIIDRVHIFISSVSSEQMQLMVYLLVSNPTQNVVTGADGNPVLTFSLPENATNLQWDDAGWTSRFIPLENGFGDMLSIRPGLQEHEILYSFELPYDGKLDLSLAFPLPEESGTLIIPQGLRIRGDGLTDAGEREMSDSVVQLYNFGALEAGQPLEFELSGRAKDTPRALSSTSMFIGLGVFALVLCLSILWLRRRSKTRAFHEDPALETSLPETQNAILDSIIALDQDYEHGSISEEEHTRRREQLKSELKEIREN
ncbi:MAG: hypothetical protein LLG42_06235 [Chloroflexi bacterium]|nr:hypothetical protein [Chloroflexota bacterium]